MANNIILYLLILTVLIVGLIFYLLGTCSSKNEAKVAVGSDKTKEIADSSTPQSNRKINEASKMTKEGKFPAVDKYFLNFISQLLCVSLNQILTSYIINDTL